MKKLLLAIGAVAILSTNVANGQAKLVETVTKKGNELVIPYERYVLPNGLTLIIHEDHSDPIVHVDVTYHVGSAREEIGKSGFAHFFEHMMFQGSDNVGDEQHFKIISEAGGTLNGTTNKDRTNYFETVPSNQLEKMLWLESDRMGFLLDAVTQKKFEVQRATVKNERGQNYDNRPYGLSGEVSAKSLYPYGHPYSWLTIGYIEDLDRVNVDDLKNFFLRWYGPNNAVLTVGGDVNKKELIGYVEKYFGSIPRGQKVEKMALPAPQLKKDRYVSMTDNYAKLPMLRVVYPTVPNYHVDEAPLDCLAEILGQGKNSIFYKNFVKAQKAVAARVSNPCSELSGEFSIMVVPYPGQKLADMQKMVRSAFEEFEKRGVTDEDVAKFRTGMEASMINGLESVSGKVSQLASFYTFTGNANRMKDEVKRYSSVTKEDVMRVYNQYVKGKHSLILSVTPIGQETNIAGANNYKVSEEGYKSPNYGYDGLNYNKAKDNFDRSKLPGSGATPVVKVPDYWTATLAGDVKVIGTQTNEIPVVTLLLHFKGGKMLDANDFSKVGLSSMFASMMDDDTKNYTAEQFSLELDKLGSSIRVSSSLDGIEVRVRALSKNLDKTIELLEEKLLNPKFTKAAFDRKKKRTIQGIKNSSTQPTYIASAVFNKVLYGEKNILSWPGTGTVETVSNIELTDVENYYKDYFSKNSGEVIVVGDVSKDQILAKLSFLDKVTNNNVDLPKIPAVAKNDNPKLYFINVSKAAQTQFRIGKVTNLKYDALGEYYKSAVLNFPLGGAFNSRLNLDLREDRGWTYGARSFFSGNKYTGRYQFSAGIKANVTDSAMMDIIKIMKEYKANSITSEELEFTKNSMTQSDARKYESGYQKAGFLSRILKYNLSADYPKEQMRILNGLTTQEIKKMTKHFLPGIEEMDVVLVGDKAKVWEGIQKLGYEVVELDKNGNKL